MRRGGVKSFVDDLVLGRGVVISRAATSLRSVETQPLTRRFVRFRRTTSPTRGHWPASVLARTYVGERILQVRLLPRAIITLRDKLFYGSG
nr:transcription initiation factor TFIID subunit 4-like isoform X2 [Biomphalaria glabrata]KAI8725833.1 transcription initiation factor TFIID subunit 4-like isoform X2 [Biomphalaria glabrata]KAI8725838.1 transcription initiation factor TFIID subunit 4-like isoform X2 [Biomphalaria glabrata]KAI8725932.1 transcription initiation factor TFIID subunit 4-like isoform X2 [Biomphalaria glabrata]KAI8725936.1 transcription initiation factor TFIID subunit 4-like isoform X2 [Biomphalaria glabrata]